MRNESRWRESKYALRSGNLRASTEVNELAVGSRLLTDIIAAEYQRVIPNYSCGTLIDLGCGKVPLYGTYRHHATRVICADWLSSLHDDEHVDMYCDLNRRLPFQTGSIDTVISSDVLEHLAEPELAFLEIGRILKPGGTLLLNTPFLYRVHEAPHDFLRHTRFSLERLTTGAGLQVTELNEMGSAIDVLADIVGKLVATVPIAGQFFASAIHRSAWRFRHTRLGEMVRKRTSATFPLAHFLVATKPFS